jgi:hypothetical protein
LRKRQLTLKQRAIVAAKMTNLRKGERADLKEKKEDTEASVSAKNGNAEPTVV